MKSRSEIEEKYKWDLTQYCKDDCDFEKRLSAISQKVDEFAAFEGKLLDDAFLLQCLEFETEVGKELSLLGVYAFLRLCEDKANRKANEMNENFSVVATKLSTATTFIEVEIGKFKAEKLKTLQKDKKFSNYARFFEGILRDKKHMLSKKEELLLSKMGTFLGGFSDNFDKFNDVDLKFAQIEDSNGKKHDLDQSNYSLYVENKDRVLRKNAFKELNGKYGENINFLTSNYTSDVKADCTFAKVRKFKSALAASIYAEEASEKVYEMLIKKVRENVSLLQRYFEIKRKMLKLGKFAIYDSFAPVEEEIDQKFTYEQALEMVKEAVSVLGEEYVLLIEKSAKDRWIDVLPNKNKESGAFSSGAYGANPVVLTNFEGNLESVFILAHELGHAMHTYFSNKNQPIQTSDYVIFVAEVASNVNEMLLLQMLLSKAKTDKEKIYYYDHFLRQMRSSIFRQTMFAEFEAYVHEEYEKETPLTPELLCEKYEDLNKFYHGEKVELIDEIKFEWARIPHFYRSFYVYKYAIGLICAIKIVNKLKKDENFANKYIKFLSSGGSSDPISLLKIAECDLEKEETFDDAFAECEKFISEWEKLLK
ncbi:MAG: oligoendopeptidase F [Clostridia bacterium]|nr:oligoendopeptidase F [Clostridia bacterium]